MQKLSCKKGPPQAVNVERSATQSSKKLEERKQSEKSSTTSEFLDVESFLKLCAVRLGIYNSHALCSSPGNDALFVDFSHLPPVEDVVTIHFNDGINSVRAQHVYDPEQLLFKSKIFRPDFLSKGEELLNEHKGIKITRANGGTRVVGIYEYNGHKLCFKQWPEAPWIEKAAYLLYRGLFSSTPSLPKSEVILINGQVFLVSKYIDGEPLEIFLEKAKNNSRDFILNEESFQRLVIFCLLTNPEDCRLQNCLVRQIENSQEYEIVLIDNERSFGRAFTDEILQEDRKISTRVHCVLFCFYEMLQREIHPSVLSEITRSPIIDMLTKQFAAENEYHRNLANLGCTLEQTVGIQCRETILGVPLGSEFLERVSYSWPRIIASIQVGKNLTSIFVEEHPEIAELYDLQTSAISHNMFEQVLERIKTIDKGI